MQESGHIGAGPVRGKAHLLMHGHAARGFFGSTGTSMSEVQPRGLQSCPDCGHNKLMFCTQTRQPWKSVKERTARKSWEFKLFRSAAHLKIGAVMCSPVPSHFNVLFSRQLYLTPQENAAEAAFLVLAA